MLPCRPCSARLSGGPFFFDVSGAAGLASPGPLSLRLSGGTGGIWLWLIVFSRFAPDQRTPREARSGRRRLALGFTPSHLCADRRFSMSVQPPRILAPRAAPSAVDVLEYEMMQEKAAALGRLARSFDAALAALAAC